MKFVLALVFLVITQCNTNEQMDREADRKALDALRKEIVELADQSVCSEDFTCKYAAFGSKPCGGPWEYLIYSTSINEADLLEKVTHYNKLEKEFNQKYGIVSDCMMVMPPDEVVCENGKCKAIYN